MGWCRMENSIFGPYFKDRQIFQRNREILRPSYIPEELPHRSEQMNQLASILVTALRGERPSNVMIFGKTGTGKTASLKFLGKEIHRVDKENRVSFLYINCENVDTHYGLLQSIGNYFIEEFNERIPFTGLSTERVYGIMKDKIDETNRVVVIVLDEIDKLVKKSSSGDDVLYHLSGINDDLKKATVSLVGVSNDLKFTDLLDPRVKSRLGEEKMVFPPYNAEQLRDILNQRSKMAFYPNVLDDSVTSLCSALAAQEHGDARRALDLLRVAGEIAERNGDDKVTDAHVYKAKNKIDLDCVTEAIRTLPMQSKLVLMAIVLGVERSEDSVTARFTTGDVYGAYQEISAAVGASSLTQRRITDLISELDMLGIVHAIVRSYGRGGRTKEIELSVPIGETKKVLEEDEMLRDLKIHRLHGSTLDSFDSSAKG